MDRALTAGEVTVRLVKGDLAQEAVDAIVVPTDGQLSDAGGVHAAVRAAGGEAYATALNALRADTETLAVSDAVLLETASLPSKNVIFTVGPRWRDGYAGEFVALERAYMAAVRIAWEKEFETLSFASISTGVFGFPDDRAAYVAFNTFVRELREKPGALKEVRFVVLEDDKFDAYLKIWAEVEKTMLG